MNKKFLKLVSLTLACVTAFPFLAGCKGGKQGDGEKAFNNESDALVFSSGEFDGVFNPFYSSSAPDGSIVGMTQIGMLSSDKDGKVAYGENEACVVLDYQAQYILADGTVVDKLEGDQTAAYTRYRFVLKNDLKFSNGSPLTMKDVLFNLYVYLDPAYYGSSTIYSTEIVGLQEYRTQTSNEKEQEGFNAQFDALAADRILRLVECFEEIYDENKKNPQLTDDQMVAKLTEKMNEYSQSDAQYATIVDDYQLAKKYFLDELKTDYNYSKGTAQDIVFTDKSGNKVTLTTDTEAFLYNEGFIKWDEKEYKFVYSLGEKSKNWTEEEAINAIVAAAKEDIDEVLTAAEEVVAALAAAKEAAREEVRAYYGAIDHSKYDDEAETVISGYVAEVMAAIDAATTAEEAQSAVAEFKTKVESVATVQPSGGNSGETQTSEPTESSKDDSKGGCGSVVGGGLFASVTLAAAAAMVLRKKKED